MLQLFIFAVGVVVIFICTLVYHFFEATHIVGGLLALVAAVGITMLFGHEKRKYRYRRNQEAARQIKLNSKSRNAHGHRRGGPW